MKEKQFINCSCEPRLRLAVMSSCAGGSEAKRRHEKVWGGQYKAGIKLSPGKGLQSVEL